MKQYMISVNRDGNGKWAYEKTFDFFLTKCNKEAFLKVIEELKQVKDTLRGRTHYTEKLESEIDNFLKMYSEKDEYCSLENCSYFIKDVHDIAFNLEWGNLSFSIEIIEVFTEKAGTKSIAITEL